MAPTEIDADQASVTSQESFEVFVFPLHRSKVIHIVRHGQGFHNVMGEIDRKNYSSMEYHDASLTDLGWQQSEALHAHLDATGIKARVELVVVSPMLCTLQTAAGVWGGGGLPEGGEKPLMEDRLGKAPHAAIAAPKGLKFIAKEWCREESGVCPCDRRSSITSYKEQFPTVDFSEVATDEDTWWKETERETAQELFFRARRFVWWLLDRPESRIAVVSHSTFILHLCRLLGSDCSIAERIEIQQRFRNCEMRSVVIFDRMASGARPAGSTDFAGRLHWNDHAKDAPVKQIEAEDDKRVPHADSPQNGSARCDRGETTARL